MLKDAAFCLYEKNNYYIIQYNNNNNNNENSNGDWNDDWNNTDKNVKMINFLFYLLKNNIQRRTIIDFSDKHHPSWSDATVANKVEGHLKTFDQLAVILYCFARFLDCLIVITADDLFCNTKGRLNFSLCSPSSFSLWIVCKTYCSSSFDFWF